MFMLHVIAFIYGSSDKIRFLCRLRTLNLLERTLRVIILVGCCRCRVFFYERHLLLAATENCFATWDAGKIVK